MSKLLFNEQPLVVDKQLATLIGLNEAMVLQQIHYWIEINKKVGNNSHEDKYWTYNTIEEWQVEFPFWSVDTVKRTLAKLRKLNILITGNFNRLKIDRTLWYTIDYDQLDKINKENEQRKEKENREEESSKNNRKDDINLPVDNYEQGGSLSQEEIYNVEIQKAKVEDNQPQMLKLPISANCSNAKVQNTSMHQGNLHSPLPEISSETSSEISKSISQSIKNTDNIELKIEKQTDKINSEYDSYQNLMHEYNQLIERLELDYLDDISFKDSVAHALKLLFLDIENKKGIKVGVNLIPSKIVRNDLKKINCFIIDHAINKFKEASREKEIRNSVAYLKTCIYNSIHELNLDIDKDLRYKGII